MWWTKKDISHCACGITVSDWGMNYFQASEGKVNYEHEPYFLEKHKIVREYILELPSDVVRGLKKDFYQQSGNKYATMQNIGIFFQDIAKRYFGVKMKNPWEKGKNCSELLFDVIIKKMVPDLKKYKGNTVKPHEIEKIVKKYLSQYIV